jgi:hypothetical protein
MNVETGLRPRNSQKRIHKLDFPCSVRQDKIGLRALPLFRTWFINGYMFSFFYFQYFGVFFINSQSWETLNTKIPLISSLEDGLYVHKLTSFLQTDIQKKQEPYIPCLEHGFGCPKRLWKTGCAVGEFYHQLKVRQIIWNKIYF